MARTHYLEKSPEAPKFCPGRMLVPGEEGTGFLIYSTISPWCSLSNYILPIQPRARLVTNNLLQISRNAPKRELASLPLNSLWSSAQLGSQMVLITPSLDLNLPSFQPPPPCLAKGGPREQSWPGLLTSLSFPRTGPADADKGRWELLNPQMGPAAWQTSPVSVHKQGLAISKFCP